MREAQLKHMKINLEKKGVKLNNQRYTGKDGALIDKKYPFNIVNVDWIALPDEEQKLELLQMLHELEEETQQQYTSQYPTEEQEQQQQEESTIKPSSPKQQPVKKFISIKPFQFPEEKK